MSTVSWARVEANTKKRENVNCNSLGSEGRGTAWRLGLSSNGQANEHTSKEKRERLGRRLQMPLDEARPEGFYTRV